VQSDNRGPVLTYARLAGWLYLFIIVAGFYVEMFVRGKIIVAGDATETAHNLSTLEPLWRLGFGGEITMWVFSIFIMAVLYVLLRPVNGTLALVALLFNVMDTSIESLNATLCNFGALFFSNGGGALNAFTQQQLAALAALALRLHEYGFGAGLLFFGFVLILNGYLIARSTYFPRWLGILAAIGGACYVLNSYSLFISPKLEDAIFPFILLPSLVAELSISLWLIFKGVNAERWSAAAQLSSAYR
jgi:Domain of unknown function (DUF4386)